MTEDNLLRTHPPRNIALYVTATSLLAVLAFTCLPMLNNAAAAPTSAFAGQASHPPVRDVILSYSYETSPNSTSGNKNLKVDSIYFYHNYVVVQADNGNTSLLAVDRLKHFDYHSATR